jgi:uncharacterized membrane protein HdeD (DUF308 family)
MSTSEVHRSDSFVTSTSREVAGRMRALRIALGVGTVALGIVVLLWPGVTLKVVAILFGVQLVVAGAMRIATAVVSTTVDGWLRAVLFLVGVLIVLAGLICLRNPFVSLLSLVILISFAWLIDGVGQLIAAGSPAMSRARWVHVLSGIVSIAGALVILYWPGLALLTFTTLGGWLLVIFGVMTAGSALRERRRVTHSEPMRAGGPTAATA